jgi:hypothetical protein
MIADRLSHMTFARQTFFAKQSSPKLLLPSPHLRGLLARVVHPPLTVVTHHTKANCDMEMAFDLAIWPRESISRGSHNSYLCGFNSPKIGCKIGSCAHYRWTHAVCMDKAKIVKVISVSKYMCGIRFAHILERFDWILTNNP